MMTKQLTGRREETAFHLAARSGNLEFFKEITSQTNKDEEEFKELLSKSNLRGETPLYLAAFSSHVDLVKLMIKHYDINLASIKASNGFDAFHIASKQGNLEVLKVLMEAIPELSMTVDSSNTTALHTAAAQGHSEVVDFFLENGSSLATIAKSNGKTALHSAARNGHLVVVKALLSKEPGIAVKVDKKGQTALHMAVKGQNVELMDELAKSDPLLMSMVDAKGNTALHIATRKGRTQIVEKLLNYQGMNRVAINKSGETAFDTAERNGHSAIAVLLGEHGIQSAKFIKPDNANRAHELKQTVSVIKHEVHDQFEHTRRTRKHIHGMVKRVNKMHTEGLNNAITSSTVVAVLIATVTFAAIFTTPGLYGDDPKQVSPGLSPGEAVIAPRIEYTIFLIFDSFALFISLAVVIVQTSVVVIERKAKKQMMAVINKLMWLACVMVCVAFLALSYVVVGDHERWLAIGVTGIGTLIMLTTLGTMCYWVIMNRLQDSKLRSIRRSSMSTTRSPSWSVSMMSESEILNNEYKTVYAI
ncbi:hypothetical protein UlMin_005961 [Ulmus minor]